MNKISKVIIFLLILIFIGAIIFKEIKMRPKIDLINDVKKIYSDIKKIDSDEIIEIIIDNGYTLNNKKYSVSGNGVIFIMENSSVMLSRNGMCAMKLPYDDKVMFQDEECPKYRLVDGQIVRLDK